MEVLVIEVCLSLWTNSVVFVMLNEHGNGKNCLIFEVKSLDNLYAGAFRQFTIGRIDV